MQIYRIAGHEILLSHLLSELEFFEKKEVAGSAFSFVLRPFLEGSSLHFINRAIGWVGGAHRGVEVFGASGGLLLNVEGCGEYAISSGGQTIGKLNAFKDLTQLDREVILGPALVLALALRGVWCLHGSAATCRDRMFVFLGESGQGKSTLAAYLSHQSGWRLVADDILPVQTAADTLYALPHYPQLKLPPAAQPGAALPEQLPVKTIVVLNPVGPEQEPALKRIPLNQSVPALIGHTAGTRLFSPVLLQKHLEFSVQAAGKVEAYRLTYPHNRDALRIVQALLEASL